MEGVKNISDLIRIDPDYREGRPHIAGTGVSVAHVGILWGEGRTPEEIGDDLTLSMQQVYAALACYHVNRELIDEDLRVQDEETTRMAEEYYAANPRPVMRKTG